METFVKTSLAPFLIVLLGVCADAAEGTAPSRIAALQESFHYAPIAVTPNETALVPENGPVVVLETLVVTDSSEEPAFTRRIQTQPKRLLEEVLFWKGKAIASKNIRGVRVDVGTWFHIGEKTIGVRPTQDIYIKVELLRLGW